MHTRPTAKAGDAPGAQSDDLPFGDVPDDELPRSLGDRCDVGVLFVEVDESQTHDADEGETVASVLRIVEEMAERFGGYAERRGLRAVQYVLGAPDAATPAADAALASGRALRDRLAQEVPGAAVNIGISVGRSVSGWIGGSRRFERLSIRALISEARSLADLARRGDAPVLAYERAVACASAVQARRWTAAAVSAVGGARVVAPDGACPGDSAAGTVAAMGDAEKVTEVPPQDERENDEGRPPKYDNAADEGTIVDGHSAGALGETGAKGEQMDA